MIKANELRIYNLVMVKGDAGIYSIEGIDGWVRIFASKEDERLYNLPLDEQIKSKKTANYHDERLVRLSGGARNGEKYPENKLKPIQLSGELLEKCGFKKVSELIFDHKDGHTIRYMVDRYWYYVKITGNLCSIEYLHQLQNLYFALTGNELPIELTPESK